MAENEKQSRVFSTGDNHKESYVASELALDIRDFLIEKKGNDIRVLDLEHVNPYFSIFIIVTSNSQVHLKSLVRDVAKRFGHYLPEKRAAFKEDLESGWVILDFIDIVVHIFLEEQRKFYNLERLWGDGKELS